MLTVDKISLWTLVDRESKVESQIIRALLITRERSLKRNETIHIKDEALTVST